MFDIDLVYLWVDGNDPAWQAKKNALCGNVETKSGANCKGRYTDNDELKYSLRSVEKHAPWIRNIFIVTDSQVPLWLDTSNPKIKIIDHKDILPPEVLPCFNSVVIEHHLHKIPGLSEHFLYSNDDMFFAKDAKPSDFFAADGLPIMRMNYQFMRKFWLFFKERIRGKKLTNYVATIRNSARLVEKKYGKYYGCKSHHNIDAYLKTTYEHIRHEFDDAIRPTLINHIRADNDIQRNIYSYAALAEKQAHLRYVGQRESLRIQIDNPRHFKRFGKHNPLLMCLNDTQYANDDDRIKSRLFMEKLFPDKSSFEL